MRKPVLLGLFLGMGLLVACGGGGGSLQSGRMLHLANTDVTEQNFRDIIDEEFKAYQCGLLNGFVGRETLVKTFRDIPGAGTKTAEPDARATHIPARRGDQADAEFAADYIISHCKSVLGQ